MIRCVAGIFFHSEGEMSIFLHNWYVIFYTLCGIAFHFARPPVK